MHCSNGRKRNRFTHGSFPRLHAFCGCSFGLFGKRNLPGVRTSINVSPKTVWRIKNASTNADSGIPPSKCWRLSRKTHASPSGRGRRRSCPSTLLLANIWIRHKPRRHLAFSFIPMTGGLRKGRKPVKPASVEGRLLSFKSVVLAISTDPSRIRIFLEPQFVQCARQRSAAQFSLSVL